MSTSVSRKRVLIQGDLVAWVRQAAVGPAELFTLLREDLIDAITRYLAGEIDVPTLTEWANLIEAADAIVYEPMHRDLIADVVFGLASPEINTPLTRQHCLELIERLRRG